MEQISEQRDRHLDQVQEDDDRFEAEGVLVLSSWTTLGRLLRASTRLETSR